YLQRLPRSSKQCFRREFTNRGVHQKLELELKKACETLAGMEYNRDMCSSVTLRAQYDRMIAEQKQRIEELRTQYYKASY
ncbi:MAG: hypothetical protein SOW57_06325, partial [Prevotella sp.]|nr:hypothetical protein [Prevotella sp.]